MVGCRETEKNQEKDRRQKGTGAFAFPEFKLRTERMTKPTVYVSLDEASFSKAF